MDKIKKLEEIFKEIDKLLYEAIKVAGTISILIYAIRSWFT